MKRALVIGGARSGKYISLLLQQNDFHVTLTDIGVIEYRSEMIAQGIEVVEQGHPDSLLAVEYDLVIKNPGIKFTVPFIKQVLAKGYRIYNEIEIALRYAPAFIVSAITGTNGKTTTTVLLARMLLKKTPLAYEAGNIGIPLSEIVYKHSAEAALIALEMSSFQLDSTYDFKPHIAAITNLEPDHLDYYNDVDDYYQSKQRIYQNMNEQDFLLLNKDEARVLEYLNDTTAQILYYSLQQEADIYLSDDIVYYHGIELFNVSDVVVIGKHNLYNAMVASTIAYLNGVLVSDIKEVLNNFEGVPHRIEYVAKINGIAYYNDSKATNIESTLVALDAFDKPVILLAGGYDKKISFAKLLDKSDKIKEIIVFGETKGQLKAIFPNAHVVNDLSEAVLKAGELAKSDDTVLFSPACASFDQFKDFEQRGDYFKECVLKLK